MASKEDLKEKLTCILENLKKWEEIKGEGMRGLDLGWASGLWLGCKSETANEYLQILMNMGCLENDHYRITISERGKKYLSKGGNIGALTGNKTTNEVKD